MEQTSEDVNPISRIISSICNENTGIMSRPAVKGQPRSIARVFADVNEKMPQQYWDYEAISVNWGPQDRYEIISKVGRGKYSEVFSGVDIQEKRPVIIKILKPVRSKKIKREIKILQVLHGGANIIKLLDLVREPDTRTPAFIFELVDCDDHKNLYPELTDLEIRYYLFELLRALQFSHSKGIMHRDVKPHNVMINHETRELRLIDWGLAEFYHPGVSYNCRVASRYYKGPELLVDFQEYDYSLDLWSLGCVMAGMIFEKEVFFHGEDNVDQLVKIINVLGSEEFEYYLAKYSIQLPADVESVVKHLKRPATSLEAFVKNPEKAHGTAIDLLSRLLKYDHLERPTAAEAMLHPYFDPVRH